MEEKNLSENEISNLKTFMKTVEELVYKVVPPMDPKVEPMLKVVHALLQEQIGLDKKYEWGESFPTVDDLFLNPNDTDIPSVDELKKMMEDEEC